VTGSDRASLRNGCCYSVLCARSAQKPATSYSLASSTFANGISGLRVLDLVHGRNRGDLSIAAVFSEKAAA
jgi:hypothetical protein